jgi:hypothetical protein
MTLLNSHRFFQIDESKQLYKVVRVMRKTGNKKILYKNLSENEAQTIVKRFPNSEKSMVVYYKQ